MMNACEALQKVEGIYAGAQLDEIARAAIRAFLKHPMADALLEPGVASGLLELTTFVIPPKR